MNEYGWGLTSAGFRRPTYLELLDALEYKARELFGSTANLSVRSPLGMFCRVFAWMLNILFAVMEDVYNSRFIDTAVGTSLYNLGRAIGLRLLSAQKASGYLLITGPPDTVIPEGWLAETSGGVQFYVAAEAVIGDSGTATVAARCTEAGTDGNVEAGLITTITNPGAVAGLESVTNPAAFTGGRGRETDAEFRERYYSSVDYAGGVNADAIRAALLQNVEGIMDARVFENDKDVEDSLGLPPHSIEAVVYGGLDGDVAQILYKAVGAGIQTYGQQSIDVLTASGSTKTVHFNRPNPVQIYVKVTNLSTDSDFPHDGVEQIKDAIVEYIGDQVSGGVSIGTTIYHQRFSNILYAISGVLDFDVLLGLSPDSLSAENIPIDSRSKAVTDEGSVTVDAD